VIAIVGAGAAGLAAAIFAARSGARDRVVALDGAARPGAKILVSGGARCNVTNTVVTEADFNSGKPNVVRRVLRAFPVDATVAFFREIGVALHEEEGGKLFPDTNRARTVLEALLAEAARRGVDVRSGHRVTAVVREDEGFGLETTRGPVMASQVVLATGGLSLPRTGSDGVGYRFAESLGHTLVPPTPALVPLVLEDEFHAGLSGVSLPVVVQVRAAGRPLAKTRGAMLFTHFGVSGPAVLDASRHWTRARLEGRDAEVSVALLATDDFADAERRLLALAAETARSHVANALGTLVPAALAGSLVAHLGIAPDTPLGQLRREDRRRLVHALTAWPLPVRDSRGYGFAEVTAGGVPLEEVDAGTLGSRKTPGLFLVGEILDVDGRIGGFNFQWAWSSGFVAGAALAAASGRPATRSAIIPPGPRGGPEA
jgi:predicted Rossmann fold flavoprotein